MRVDGDEGENKNVGGCATMRPSEAIGAVLHHLIFITLVACFLSIKRNKFKMNSIEHLPSSILNLNLDNQKCLR